VAAIVALHPAPFEAAVWVSAQSELLAAALLLIALHLWLGGPGTRDQGPRSNEQVRVGLWSLVFRPWSVGATLALALALLAKESAVIGLPLLFLIGWSNAGTFRRWNIQHLVPYALPTLDTLGYVALQVAVERRNYLLEQGGYGLGPQIILNPLRSLALIVAPLPGTEHADAAWLIPAGAIIALALLGLGIGNWGLGLRSRSQSPIPNSQLPIILALGLTLLPTAPFASPPDSRYLYLPVIAAALPLGLGIGNWGLGLRSRSQSQIPNPKSPITWFTVAGWLLVVALAWWSAGELHEREWRFAAGAGPGGSLWRLAATLCEAGRPDRMVVVEPPIAPPHVAAIVELSCGSDVAAAIVGRDQVEAAIEGRSVVIEFPGGSAQVARET
jgi:hypothetical protein